MRRMAIIDPYLSFRRAQRGEIRTPLRGGHYRKLKTGGAEVMRQVLPCLCSSNVAVKLLDGPPKPNPGNRKPPSVEVISMLTRARSSAMLVTPVIRIRLPG